MSLQRTVYVTIKSWKLRYTKNSRHDRGRSRLSYSPDHKLARRNLLSNYIYRYTCQSSSCFPCWGECFTVQLIEICKIGSILKLTSSIRFIFQIFSDWVLLLPFQRWISWVGNCYTRHDVSVTVIKWHEWATKGYKLGHCCEQQTRFSWVIRPWMITTTVYDSHLNFA